MRKAHVGLISQWYPPERVAGAMPHTIATALRDLGHEVTVLTGLPNYPDGKIYAGYRLRLYQSETVDGITVHRVALYPSHDRSAAKRAVNYLSFAVTSSALVGRALHRSGVDVALVYSSPITAGFAARWARARYGIPYVALIEDMWPQSIAAGAMLGGAAARFAERLLNPMCDFLYRGASSIGVTSPGMRELIEQRVGTAIPIVFTPNWVDERYFHPVDRDPAVKARLGLTRPFVVMYAGNIGEMQGLDTVLEAARLLLARTDIEIALVGSGTELSRLRHRAAQWELGNVTFVPSQPIDNMAGVLAASDVQVVALRKSPLFEHTLPSKFQAALAVGRPIICLGAGDLARAASLSAAATVVRPGAQQELADAIERAADAGRATNAALGVNALAYYAEHFSAPVGCHRLGMLLQEAAERAGRR